MSPNVVQLMASEHSRLKLTPNKNFNHIANQHIAPIIINEMPSVATDLSIVFIKNGTTEDGSSENGTPEDYMCVAMMGLKNGENLLVKSGLWQGEFLPAGLSHYPLALIPNPEDQDKYIVSIDLNSESVGEESGEALFNEDGSSSEFYDKRRQALENYYAASLATKDFIKTLQELDLLVPQTLTYNIGEEKRSVNGIYIIDEEKFNALSDESFLNLRKKGYLPAIHSHLISLQQTRRLVKRLI